MTFGHATSEPLVSIIITTKNSALTLEACLKSIRDQSYKNIELIVVDNFSTDTTQEIAKKYTDKVFIQGPERSPQRNFGVKQATGIYVAIIDSDMELSKEVVSSCVQKMKEDETILGLVIPEESFGEGFWAQCKKLERSFYVGIPWMEAARFFKKDAFERAGGYNESMVSGEDWDLSQRIESQGKLSRAQEFIYHNEGSISLMKTLKKKYYYAKLFSKYLNNNQQTTNVGQQTSVIGRYRLFFSKPRLLFKKPLTGLGMLFMKTGEFFMGALGLILSNTKLKNTSMNNDFNILLLGTHGQKNIGDELLLHTFLFNLRKYSAKKLNFFVNSYDPKNTAKENDVNSFHTTADKIQLLIYIFKADVVLFAGGSILKELYSAYGRNTHSVLNMLTVLILFVKYIASKKVILSNIGIGPLSTKRALSQTKFILGMVNFVSVRDEVSFDYAKKLNSQKNIQLIPDAVFSLSKEHLITSVESTSKTTKTTKIVLNLCRNISNPAKWDSFIFELLSFFEKMLKNNSNLEIIGLPMQSGFEIDDLTTLISFEEQLRKKCPNVNFKIVKTTDFLSVANIIETANCVIAERLHTLIISTILRKPFVALEYDVKVTSFIEDIGMSSYGVKICEKFDSDDLQNIWTSINQNYDSIKAKLDVVALDRYQRSTDYFKSLCENFINAK